MEKKKNHSVYKIVMLIILTSLITYIITSSAMINNIKKAGQNMISASEKTTNDDSSVSFDELKAILKMKFIGEVDDQKMLEGAKKGYVEGLGDPYTTYLTKEEMDDLTEETSGQYVGIGVYVSNDIENDTILIVGVMKESPALEAGLQQGDIITKVDGVEYKGSELTKATSVLKGVENTEVEVTILREEEELTKKITRKRIIVEHVVSKMLDNQIGYIQIDSFDDGVAAEFEKQYKELKENGAEGLIIDLRSNGGGVVDEATDIADLFVPIDTPVLITKNKSGAEESTNAKKEQIINEKNIIVLVNQGTASASEILAASLKENNDAIIVGKKTYGKGVIQTVYKLKNGAGLKITTEEYFTPKHNEINEKGISPDEDIELTRDENGKYETSEDKDVQLKKAIEVLLNNR